MGTCLCTQTFTSPKVGFPFVSWSAAALHLSIHITADMRTSTITFLTGILH